MTRNRFWRLTIAALVIPSACVSPAVFAAENGQETPENEINLQADSENKGATSLGSITVTEQQSYYEENASSAARIELPIIETPQSVYVINEDLIADQQAFRLDQVLQNDSSVQKSNNFLGAYSSYQIRGFTLSNTANYLRDGQPFYHVTAPPVEILERVEVLKGPSSVLYGTLAPGGLINLIPKRPTRERQTSIKATVGSFDLQHYHIDHGGPITDSGNLRYRINAVYEDSNSFREFVDGSDFNTKRKTVSAAVDWDASERTSLRINFDLTEDDRPQDIGLVNLTGDFSNQSHDLIYNQPWTQYDSDVWNLAAELNHEFSEYLSLRTGYSFHDFKRERYDNQPRGLPDADGNINIRARRRLNRREFSTYYVDLIGDFQTGPLKHEILFGVNQTDVDIVNNETERNEVFATNIFNPVVIPDPQIATRPEKDLGTEDRSGVTIHDVISIGEQWRVLVGARYDEFNFEIRNPDGNTRFEQDADYVTPRFGALYLLNPGLSLYGSYSQSFEPNAIVSAAFANAGEVLDPTVSEQFEVGIKWEALNGRLLTTGALFTIDRKDAAFEDVLSNTIVQRGKQTHEGAEITVAGLIGEHISITGSATYLSAEFTEDDNPDLIGNTPAGVPDLALSLASEYAFLGGALNGLSIQGGWFYEGDRPIDDANTFDLDAYNRIDLGLKYLLTRGESAPDFILRLTAQNITDEEYFKGRSPLGINPERPREIRASVEVKF